MKKDHQRPRLFFVVILRQIEQIVHFDMDCDVKLCRFLRLILTMGDGRSDGGRQEGESEQQVVFHFGSSRFENGIDPGVCIGLITPIPAITRRGLRRHAMGRRGNARIAESMCVPASQHGGRLRPPVEYLCGVKRKQFKISVSMQLDRNRMNLVHPNSSNVA